MTSISLLLSTHNGTYHLILYIKVIPVFNSFSILNIYRKIAATKKPSCPFFSWILSPPLLLPLCCSWSLVLSASVFKHRSWKPSILEETCMVFKIKKKSKKVHLFIMCIINLFSKKLSHEESRNLGLVLLYVYEILAQLSHLNLHLNSAVAYKGGVACKQSLCLSIMHFFT